ncbi:Alpha/Beta hydrolase protein [Gamsiella multidivaricata]|uniref:Alpha/Beta hydrolase protein n=1 Tax=Gamsiella multidivaricata TaxID=101098 RepID=UPI0022204AA9|nr:Alpha/Beta hydrolase protein [Gamsiella multidivaricata]KAI7816906.1 Alpha/Beta hydrolase protein [Gamsiella multidivaricata]
MGPDAVPHLQIHYWNGIQKALTKLGAKVVVAKVPRTGSIKERAEDLHKILSTTMQGMSINFVAHSMGGLDCRYLISHIHDKNYDVQSLTTLSTPHRGSPVMDWFRDNVGVGLFPKSEEEAMRKLGEAAMMSGAVVQEALSGAVVQEASEALHSMMVNATEPAHPSAKRAAPYARVITPLLDRLIPYLDTPAYANLTTTYCREVFNPNTPDDPRVSYYSYGASVPQIPLWAPLGFPWEVIKAKEGENDGLVSTMSARWGQYVDTVEADHWDLNNRWRLKIGYNQKPFDAVELYMNVATRLYKEGF